MPKSPRADTDREKEGQRKKWHEGKARARQRAKDRAAADCVRLVIEPRRTSLERILEAEGLVGEMAQDDKTVARLMERLALERAEEKLAQRDS